MKERRKEAVSFLTRSIKSIKSGGLDEFLETKLASYRARSELGKEKRMATKTKCLEVVDILASKAA